MANAGILLTQVHYLKQGAENSFCVVDAAMNDLIRPALYQAYQEIIEVNKSGDRTATVYDIVGPVCESSDFLGKGRRLSVREGDLLAVRTAGAYGAVMSSNYNARPRPAEVMVGPGHLPCCSPTRAARKPVCGGVQTAGVKGGAGSPVPEHSPVACLERPGTPIFGADHLR